MIYEAAKPLILPTHYAGRRRHVVCLKILLYLMNRAVRSILYFNRVALYFRVRELMLQQRSIFRRRVLVARRGRLSRRGPQASFATQLLY